MGATALPQVGLRPLLVLSTEAAGIACAGAALSIALIGFEIFIVRITSSVTLGILGQFKEIMQIALSMLIFRERMNIQTALGLAISLVAANYYKMLRFQESRRQRAQMTKKLARNETSQMRAPVATDSLLATNCTTSRRRKRRG